MIELEAVRHLTVALLVVVGSFFLAVGTIGLLRFPNVYNRMHATSKPTTLGTAAMFLAGFVRFGPGGAGLTSLVGIVFLFLTVPTGAHMISRAAQKTGVPFLGGVTWPTAPDDDPEPSTDERDPSTDERDPSTNEREPSTDEREQPVDERDPSTDERDPSTDERDPSTDERDPSTDE